MENPTAAIDSVVDRVRFDLDTLERWMREGKTRLETLLKERARNPNLSIEDLRAFLKKPWAILPKGAHEYWVIIPRWVDLQVGWLERSTESYNFFVVNRYAQWLGNVPEELREELKLSLPFKAVVKEGALEAAADVAARFKDHLSGQLPDGRWKVKLGHQFDLLADLIRAGTLPFAPQPVDAADLLPEEKLFPLRQYQRDAWDEFLARGACGIYWPWSVGKSIFGLYALARIKGPCLVVVPSRMLAEQWEERIRKTVPAQEIEVVTYQATRRRHEGYVLSVFDECHRLPADTFSRLATIPTKYRLGLSATPWREDGRTNYIFALTGWPLGLDWRGFVESGILKPPHVEVRIVRAWRDKVAVTLKEVAAVPKGKSCLVFCDSINLGRELAGKLGCPHVYGDSKNRLETITAAAVVVVSRVGDEGLSLPNLARVIEVDFLGGSRRQEGQRVGRLLHADTQGTHLVLMTDEEFNRFGGRFRALEEKGFRVRVTR